MNLNTNWSVKEFMEWWVKERIIKPPFLDGIFFTDIAASIVLFRNGPFQVEMYISKPNTESPYHSHPGVDSLLMYLTGNLVFGKDGKQLDLSEFQKPRETDPEVHFLLGKFDILEPDQLHNLKTLGEGGAFFSFEKWNDRVPNSVTVNWEGEPSGSLHKQVIEKNTA
jgi:hypothetical protein